MGPFQSLKRRISLVISLQISSELICRSLVSIFEALWVSQFPFWPPLHQGKDFPLDSPHIILCLSFIEPIKKSFFLKVYKMFQV
jgi:hypothetical protein